ncbi:MAG: right-handed parallel beta-helix repeat-containing protein [Candidatus Omnitrophica bacterium]|nr:right-handed parallel beta-helix repeat-containing protein [Candidatus Omnitrophota bacterium]
MRRIIVVLIAVIFLCPGSSFGYGQPQRGPVTLYVAPNAGSLGECMEEHPCPDVAKALTFAIPGDTIVIREGEYKGFRLENIRATAEKPITIRGVGKVRISSNDELRDTRDNIQISNCDWIVIDNIQSFDAKRAGIRIDQSHHVTVRNSVFGNNETWGIFANHSNDLLLENNEAFGSRKQHGIYCSNSGDRPVIRGNKVHDNVACGIHMNGDLSGGEGRDVAGDGVISGALVENNVITGNGKIGGAAINGDGVHDSIIRNNILLDNHASGIALFKGDGASGPKNIKVEHNQITQAPGARQAINISDDQGDIVLTDNIIKEAGER